jgi:hypothetical protein
MSQTRIYDFTTGIETAAAPTVSDPSADADVVSLGYANKSYARGVATVAALKALGTSARTDNLPIMVDDLQAWFYFDSASSATGNDLNVITPTAGTGRWIRIGHKTYTTTERDAFANVVTGFYFYNSTTQTIQVWNGSAWASAGSGGGGGGLVWTPEDGTGPINTQENGLSVYNFVSGLTQYLWTSIIVPSTFSSGSQLNLDIAMYSPSASNTILLTGTSYLIRENNDAISSTTNSRTTTNSALTNAVANRVRKVSLDITSSTGTINSVAVSAGDIIRVRLARGSDTDTADIRFIENSSNIR